MAKFAFHMIALFCVNAYPSAALPSVVLFYIMGCWSLLKIPLLPCIHRPFDRVSLSVHYLMVRSESMPPFPRTQEQQKSRLILSRHEQEDGVLYSFLSFCKPLIPGGVSCLVLVAVALQLVLHVIICWRLSPHFVSDENGSLHFVWVSDGPEDQSKTSSLEFLGYMLCFVFLCSLAKHVMSGARFP
jgi:hypothetical protein